MMNNFNTCIIYDCLLTYILNLGCTDFRGMKHLKILQEIILLKAKNTCESLTIVELRKNSLQDYCQEK